MSLIQLIMKIPMVSGVRMFAKNKKTLEVTEITNHLYFFEEEGIREIGEEGHHQGYEVWIELPKAWLELPNSEEVE